VEISDGQAARDAACDDGQAGDVGVREEAADRGFVGSLCLEGLPAAHGSFAADGNYGVTAPGVFNRLFEERAIRVLALRICFAYTFHRCCRCCWVAASDSVRAGGFTPPALCTRGLVTGVVINPDISASSPGRFRRRASGSAALELLLGSRRNYPARAAAQRSRCVDGAKLAAQNPGSDFFFADAAI